MPTFDESKDLMDAYLYRFEQHAKVQNWDPEVWSICLSSHLTGQALDLFQSLTDADGKVQYTTLKAELLKQFACTAEDARLRFRRSRPGQSKTGEAIGAELKRHLQTWMDRTEVRTKEGLMDPLLQEQLIDSVSKDLSVFLVEHDAKTFEDMVKLIDRFKQAHPNKPIARKQESTVTAGVGHMPGNYVGGQNRGGGKTSPAKRLRDNYWPYHSNQSAETYISDSKREGRKIPEPETWKKEEITVAVGVIKDDEEGVSLTPREPSQTTSMVDIEFGDNLSGKEKWSWYGADCRCRGGAVYASFRVRFDAGVASRRV
ncbi:hypothetical protein ACOMHN_021208 [Nucella lapillus]